MDAYSRYLIACVAVRRPDGDAVRRAFEPIFATFGLPEAIRTDNGPPFAAPGTAALPRLAVWWLKLGIRHERIAPGRYVPSPRPLPEPPWGHPSTTRSASRWCGSAV